jgi:hypothetical protein
MISMEVSVLSEHIGKPESQGKQYRRQEYKKHVQAKKIVVPDCHSADKYAGVHIAKPLPTTPEMCAS